MAKSARLTAMLNAVINRTRTLRPRAVHRRSTGREHGTESTLDLMRKLLGEHSQAAGVALAQKVLASYETLDEAARLAFLVTLSSEFAPDPAGLEAAWQAYREDASPDTLRDLHRASEPPRQELLRRLNQAPFATPDLVGMRADLLKLLPTHPELRALEADFVHLLRSWFNRGFLVMRLIDWSSSADLLERIIAYEAVHSIASWSDLRDRLLPSDRRCYAFFHPAMAAEPLIFVEVALTQVMPDSIQALLSPERAVISSELATVAVFYSISNCQPGLAGISFGEFLIKQVVEDLAREFPGIREFATLSPVPGLVRWLQQSHSDGDVAKSDAAKGMTPREHLAVAARYLLVARDARGRPKDPVARFHLTNGAMVERLCWMGDTSDRGIAQSGGVMVNYLYDLTSLEANIDAFARDGKIAASDSVSRLLAEAGSVITTPAHA